jgi:type II secretory pathway component PulK
MKTHLLPAHRNRTQHGSAVIVIMTLLSIMLALITADIVSVRSLNRELLLLNKKQQHRWEQHGGK